MSELAKCCRIKAGAEKTAYQYAVSLIMQGLAEASDDQRATTGLLNAARALSWVERSEPEQLFSSVDHRVGADVIELLFDRSGRTVQAVAAALANAADITEVSARDVLEITAAVTMASLTDVTTEKVSEEYFVESIQRERQDVAKDPVTAALLANVDNRESPSTSDAGAADGESKPGLIVAGVVAVLVLVGVGFFATSGGDDSVDSEPDAEQAFATDENDDAANGEETTSTDADDTEPVPVTNSDDGDIVSLSIPMRDIVNTDSDASGVLGFDFNTVTGEVCYSVESSNIEGPYRSHIHVGADGVKGGIVVDLGPLSSGDVGCVDNLPVDTAAVLADPAGHYAELHDVSEEWTIRGQLSEAIGVDGSSSDSSSVVDTEGGGARTVLESGTIFLQGDVPDQATADELVASLSDVDARTPVVDELRVVAGAPIPSGRVVIADAVFFDVNSDVVKQIDSQTLAAITALAESREDWILTVVGHTDSSGSDVYNLELSLRRASALRDLLAAQGIADENLRVRGAGETAPIGDNTTADGRAQNRRIEFELTPKG